MDGIKRPSPRFCASLKNQDNNPQKATAGCINKRDQNTQTAKAQTEIKTIPLPKKADFTVGAREFKKRQLGNSLFRGVTESLLVVLVFVTLLAGAGLFINHKFQGRSMPFTYVGEISIGGMTEDQIKAQLDEKYAQMQIKFIEGGLEKQATLGQLEIEVDTSSVAKQAVPQNFNPLAFFNAYHFEVPIKTNDRLLSGYVARNINSAQSKSEDASLIFEKENVAIKPENTGFTSDSTHIIKQIKFALSIANEPNVDVTVVTTKPSVTAKDLQDDKDKINKLLQTPISIKYGYSTLKPNVKQKLAWLKISQQPGVRNVDFEFQKGLIRNYILEQTKKYNAYNVSAEGSQTISYNRIAIDNIDEIVDSITVSLSTGQQSDNKLVIRTVSDQYTSIGADDTVAVR